MHSDTDLTGTVMASFPPPGTAFLNLHILPSVRGDLILSIGGYGSVHKVGYGHKRLNGNAP